MHFNLPLPQRHNAAARSTHAAFLRSPWAKNEGLACLGGSAFVQRRLIKVKGVV